MLVMIIVTTTMTFTGDLGKRNLICIGVGQFIMNLMIVKCSKTLF